MQFSWTKRLLLAALCSTIFLPAYAASLGKGPDDYYDILEELEEEAMSIFPRLPDLLDESYRLQTAGEDDA